MTKGIPTMGNTSLHRIAHAFWSAAFVLFAWLAYRGRFDHRGDGRR